MGLAGVFISSCAGGLSIVISIVAIRRTQRRQKISNLKEACKVVVISAGSCSDITSDQNAEFIKDCTNDQASKCSDAVVQSYHESSGLSMAPDKHTKEESYVLHHNRTLMPHSMATAVVADDEFKHHVDSNVTEPRQWSQRSSPPLKEFTTQASDVAFGSDPWQDSYERFETSRLCEDCSTAPNNSGSETESFSFANDGFLSEEETTRMGDVDHVKVAASSLDMPKHTELQENRGKKVSLQLGHYEDRHREFSNSMLDGEKIVATDILASRNMERKAGVVSVPENCDSLVRTWDEADDLTAIINDPDSQTERLMPVVPKTMTETQGISDFIPRRKVYRPGEHSENQNVSPGNRSPLASVQPLSHVTALDDVVAALPSSEIPAVMREQNYGTSMTSDFLSAGESRQWKWNESESSKTFSRPNRVRIPQNSQRSRDEEKEKDGSNPVSSAERLSRQSRRGTDRYGMFRRSSHPTLKRFRFSDRIKVRPLRPSGRSSN